MEKELVWQEGTQDSITTHRIRIVDLAETDMEEPELSIDDIEDIEDLEEREETEF